MRKRRETLTRSRLKKADKRKKGTAKNFLFLIVNTGKNNVYRFNSCIQTKQYKTMSCGNL